MIPRPSILDFMGRKVFNMLGGGNDWAKSSEILQPILNEGNNHALVQVGVHLLNARSGAAVNRCSNRIVSPCVR